MSESTGLPQGDPLNGADIAGRWSFGYDMPDDLGGGFVCGELLLRSGGILLRRYGGSSYRAGQVTWKYGPWDEVSWWTGETDLQQAVALLKSRKYDLFKHDPVPIDRSTYGPIRGSPSVGQPLWHPCSTMLHQLLRAHQPASPARTGLAPGVPRAGRSATRPY